jgi:hypothetical protein
MANFAGVGTSGQTQFIGSFVPHHNASLVPATVVASSRIGPGPKLVYSKLLTYAVTQEVATNKRLAADLAISPRSVRNYITALKAAGLIAVRTHPGKPNSYALTRLA